MLQYWCFLCSGATPALYTVIPEKTTSVGGAMMGSSHVYDINQTAAGPKKVRPNQHDDPENSLPVACKPPNKPIGHTTSAKNSNSIET